MLSQILICKCSRKEWWEAKFWNAVSRVDKAAECIILATKNSQNKSKQNFEYFCMFCHFRVVLTSTVILIHERYLSPGLSLGSWKVIICRTNGCALCGQWVCILWMHSWCIFLGGPLPICPPAPLTGLTLMGVDPAHLGTGLWVLRH